MAREEITIVARYDSGEKTSTISRKNVEVIEFNSTTFNPGPPPTAIGIGPPLKGGTTSTAEAPDTIVLRGGQRRACKLIGIEEQVVHCAGKDGDYTRKVVLRILVGGQ